MDESQMLAFGFDLLDPTKLVPEEYVPITWLGKMQLNANPMNYFAETEQIAVRPLPLLVPHPLEPDLSRYLTYLDAPWSYSSWY
jgi:catalase